MNANRDDVPTRLPFLVWAVLLFFSSANLSRAQDSAEPYQVYFGNLHSHTSYSDGSGTPADAFQHARDTGLLDFLAVTEHNHDKAEAGAKERWDGLLIATRHELYNGADPDSLVSAAKRFSQDGKFVALMGQEFSTISSGNHANVFEILPVITVKNGAFDKLFEFLDQTPDSLGESALVMLNHPRDYEGRKEYGADDFNSRQAWLDALKKYARLIEVLGGPAMAKRGGARPKGHADRDYLAYLNLGLHLAPTASQDNHYRTWGTATDARTAVLAKGLSKTALLSALKARRSYATHDKNLRVWFRVEGHLMGDILKTNGSAATMTAEIKIKDDDEPTARYKVELLHDKVGDRVTARVIGTKTMSGDGTARFEGVRYGGWREFYLVKITQSVGRKPKDLAWTAPVWFEP